MGIKALLGTSKNKESKRLTYYGRSIGLSTRGQEEEGRIFRIGDATTVNGEKLLKVGEDLRTIRREIDMIRIRAAVSGANLEFLVTEVEMPVLSVIFVEVLF
jgi:hypothetical protein